MPRPTTSSKTTAQPQPSPAAPMTAADRIEHRERLRALPPGTAMAICQPGKPLITGLRFVGVYNNVDGLVRNKHKEVVRCPWHLLREAINANDLGKLIEAPEEAPAAPADGAQA
ncbi:hypothetical protein [Synechococcus sp. CCAP 1479/10]|nr:hypothetical protein [Synechococcus sp. CCAP 1479/10]